MDVTARTLTDADVEAVAEAFAARLRPLLGIQKDHLTPEEAGALTGLTPKALNRLREGGVLLEGRHWRKVSPKRVRYLRAGLLAWLDSLPPRAGRGGVPLDSGGRTRKMGPSSVHRRLP